MNKFAAIVAFVLVITAVNPVSAKTISEEQMGVISANCSSVKFRLENIQKADSKNRVHLGAQYESIATNLMMNLNLRLTKNDLTNTTIADQHKTFVSERTRFKDDFIGYSQELDALIDMDCKNNPQAFYDKLEVVRAKRLDVERSINRLNEILTKHRQSIVELQKELVK